MNPTDVFHWLVSASLKGSLVALLVWGVVASVPRLAARQVRLVLLAGFAAVGLISVVELLPVPAPLEVPVLGGGERTVSLTPELAERLRDETAAPAPADEEVLRHQVAAGGDEVLDGLDRSVPSWVILGTLIAWLTGVGVCCAMFVRNFSAVYQRMLSPGTTILDENSPLQAEAEALADECGLSRLPRLLVSPHIRMPCTTGALFPLVLLPRNFAERPARERRICLLHEMQHIRQRDFAANLGVLAVRTIFWFNPLLFLMERAFHLACERRCDERVCEADVAPHDYGSLLIELAARPYAGCPAAGPRVFVSSVLRDYGELEKRLRHLAALPSRKPPGRPATVAMLLLCGTAATGLAALNPAAQSVWSVEGRRAPLSSDAELVGHWPLDEPVGASHAVDLAGGARAEIAGATVGRDGRIGRAYEFDGESCFLRIDSRPLADLSYPFTVSAWTRTFGNNYRTQSAVFLGTERNDRFFFIGTHLGKAVLSARWGMEECYIPSDAGVLDGRWHHLAAVFVSETERIFYVDGVRQGVDRRAVALPERLTRFEIGRNGRPNTTDFFEGEIDDVRLYRAALSESEIREIMPSGWSWTARRQTSG